MTSYITDHLKDLKSINYHHAGHAPGDLINIITNSLNRDPDDDGLAESLLQGKMHEMGLSSFDAEAIITELQKDGMIVRRPIFYNPDKTLSNLFRLSGTSILIALMRVEFWLLVGYHVVLVMLYDMTGKKWSKLPMDTLGLVGTVISFLLVFMSNTAFTRFFQQYTIAFGMENNVNNIITLACTHAPGEEKAALRSDIYKYATAAHFLSISTLQSYKAAKMYDWTYTHLVGTGMLTAEEAGKIQHLSSYMPVNSVITWLLRRIQKDPDFKAYGSIETQCLQLSFASLQLHKYQSQPIPWPYYSLLNIVTVVYLILLGYGYVMDATHLTMVTFFLVCLSLFGLRENFICLSDPFGTDRSDLPLFQELIRAQQRNEISVLTT